MNSLMKCITLAFCAVTLLNRCGIVPLAGSGTNSGGGSETIALVVTDSAIYGVVTAATINGDSAIQGAPVKLFDANYLPFYPCSPDNFYDSTVSDESGRFRFSHSKPGFYRLHVRSASTGRSALIDSVFVGGGADTLYDSLTDPGAVMGHVYSVVTGSDTVEGRNHAVFIAGTQLNCSTDTTGAFVLEPVPEGYYMLLGAPYSIIHPMMDTITDKTALLNTLKTMNKGNTPDSIEPGKILTGKRIYLKR